MAYLKVGFTAVARDGTRVWADWGDGALPAFTYQEPGKAPVVVATTTGLLGLSTPDAPRPIYLDAERDPSGVLRVAFAAQNRDQAFYWTPGVGGILTLSNVFGQYCVCCTPDGDVWWVPFWGAGNPRNGRQVRSLMRGTVSMATGSQGFAGYDAQGYPRTMDSAMAGQFGPYRVARVTIATNDQGLWRSGGDTSADRQLVEVPDGRVLVGWTGQSPIGGKIKVTSADGPVLAMSIPGGWYTAADFTPVVDIPTPQPPPMTTEPEPTEPTDPSQEAPMPAQPDLSYILPALQTARARGGAGLSNDECVALLNSVAWFSQGKLGLLAKPSGNHGTRYDGVLCAVDWLVDRATGWGVDCLSSAGGGDVSTPVLGDMEQFPSDRIVPPIVPESGTAQPPATEPPGTQPPVTGGVSPADVEAALEALNNLQVALHDGIDRIRQDISALRALVENTPVDGPAVLPDYVGTVRLPLLGTVTIRLTPEIPDA